MQQYADVAVEHKFNPWHDAKDGRFARAGAGRWFGGGGGSFDGGGASGSWTRPRPKAPRVAKLPRIDPPRSLGRSGMVARKPATAVPDMGHSTPVSRAPVRPSPPPSAKPWRDIVKNGYRFTLDDTQRTRRVAGAITLDPSQPRSRTAQRRAGHPDRRPTDDGGHYIARRFKGPTKRSITLRRMPTLIEENIGRLKIDGKRKANKEEACLLTSCQLIKARQIALQA